MEKFAFVDLQFSMATINVPKITSFEVFDHPGFLSDFHVFPEHCDLVNDITHIFASAAQSDITHYYDQCRGYEERKRKRLHAFNAAR